MRVKVAAPSRCSHFHQAVPAFAQRSLQPAISKSSAISSTPAPPDMPHIPQTGAKADAIKKTLAKIKLPRGFKIKLYASCPMRGTWRSGRRGSSPSSAPARARSGPSPTATRTASPTR